MQGHVRSILFFFIFASCEPLIDKNQKKVLEAFFYNKRCGSKFTSPLFKQKNVNILSLKLARCRQKQIQIDKTVPFLI